MAIQNFLSGGYYGKLGATVGQRWKNKRTIRTYVVPNNPRTPSQQANRGKFADAVTYSQIGMQMNYYCALFDDPNMTRWNYRMKVARELKAAGFNDLDLIPLYPMSYTPSILLSDFTRSKVEGNTHITFSCQNLTSEVDRVFSIMFALYTEENVFLGYKLYLGYYYANNPGFIEVDVDDINEINNNCFVRIVSNDDENLNAPLIASAQLQVTGKVIDVHTFDNTIKDVEVTNEGITITFAELWKATPTTNIASVDVKCVVNGSLVTINGTDLMLFNNNGYCALEVEYQTTEPQSLPAFPIGSSIDNLNVDYKGETWDITIQNASTPYSNSDTNRTFNNTISSIARNGTTFTITLATAIPTISTHNLSLSIVAVQNGDFVEENVSISNISGKTITFEQSGATGANIYAFPVGSSITLSGSIVGNGVTYTASKQTAQAISNTDLSRTFNNSISSIARSETTFIITLANILPTLENNNLSLSVKAVKNGAFVTETISNAVVSAKTITFNQSGASGANIYAFPTGSAITLSGSIISNNVTYTASIQTEQAISNTDLNRTFNSSISSIARSGTIFTINFVDTLPAGTNNNLSLLVKAVKNGAFVSDYVVITEVSGKTITFNQSGATGANIYAFPTGSTITLSGSIISNNVTYTASIQTEQTISNTDLNRTFNNSISSIARSGTVFTINFADTLPAGTNNNLSLLVKAVKNGAFVSDYVVITEVSGKTITFNQSGATGANIYAFPNGSAITLSGSVVGNGVTYTASIQTEQAISNTDLNRTFNNSISSIARSGTTFTINFADTLPTVTENNLSLLIKAVKNGAFVSDYVTIETMSVKAMSFNQSGATGANIYAFPNGSTIALSGSVIGNGVTYTVSIKTEQAISNTDLTRSIISSPAWNSASTGVIQFTLAFGGIISATSKTYNMVTSGRLGIRTPEAQLFNIVSNGTNLIFTCAGSRALYPMNTNGDKISITSTDLVVNGVTYNIANQDVNLRNAITTSNYFDELEWEFIRDGDGTPQKPLQFLEMMTYVYGANEENKEWASVPVITRVEDYDDVIICEPTGATALLENDGEAITIHYQDYYGDATDNDALALDFNVVNENIPTLQINGITYSFTQSVLAQKWSRTISNWVL